MATRARTRPAPPATPWRWRCLVPGCKQFGEWRGALTERAADSALWREYTETHQAQPKPEAQP